jgi:sigma-B regulation protein RsbU (phosphoserine phosphatase)
VSLETPQSKDPAANTGGEELSAALSLLARMNQDFAESLGVETALKRALPSIVESVGARSGSIWLVAPESHEIVCHASVGPGRIDGARLSENQGIVGRAVRENMCQRIYDVSSDPDFAREVDERTGIETRSVLCSPISFMDRPLGAIQMVNKAEGDGHFSDNDARLLRVLASSAALAMANARMTADLVDHERVKRDLGTAAEIQRGLLPLPRPEPFPIFGVNVPARTVSGDFYDILPLEDGRVGFCLGDVSGKGMDAALMMVKTSSLYRYLARSIQNPNALLAELDRELSETASHGKFVTMVAGVYDRKTRVAVIANAGHEPALLRTGPGRFEEIRAQAPPLGIGMASGSFPEVALSLEGCSLYIFSDGLTEACAGDAPLGAEGVKRIIDRFAGEPIGERVDDIVTDVATHQIRDDLTMVAVEPEADEL